MWQLVDEMDRLVDALPAGEERAATMAAIAQIDMLHDKSAEAIAWAERAIGEAERVGAKVVRAQAMIERATAMTESRTAAPTGSPRWSTPSPKPSASRTGCCSPGRCTT